MSANPHRQRRYRRFDERVTKLPAKPCSAKLRKKEPWRRFGCHKWTGAITSAGYGSFFTGARWTAAHRWNFARKTGRRVNKRLVLDHLCRNRWCVNPRHLEPVTVRVNNLRSHNPAVLLHKAGVCKQGHKMTPENTIIEKETGRRLKRKRCRTCKVARLAAYVAKRREAAS